MRRRRRKPQFSLMVLLALPVGVAFFVPLWLVLAPKLGWIGTIVFFVLTSPFWLFLVYAFCDLLEGLRGGRPERDLPSALPPEISEEGVPPGRRGRKRKRRSQDGGWWHPLGGYNKQ